MIVAPGATSVSVDVFFADDTGYALTGKVAADFPACKWSGGSNTADTTIALTDLAAITTAHPNDNTAGGIKEREGGWYRLDLPNNMLTAAGRKTLTFAETTNKRIIAPFIDCQYTQVNLIQAVSQTATLDANNVLNVSTKYWAGSVITATSIPVATAAGASGGLVIAGSNAPTTFAGTGSTAGLTITGGSSATGALTITGGSSSGAGIIITTTSGDGITVTPTAGHALTLTGQGTTKHGINATGSATTGVGILATGGGTSGDGFKAIAGASGHGIVATGVGTTKHGISATGGATTSAGLALAGGATSGDGLLVTTTSGHGLSITATGASKHGVIITGGDSGTSDGLKLVAGSGGVGFRLDTLTASGAVTLAALSMTTLTASGAVAFQSTFAVTTSTALAALSCSTLTASGAVALQSTVTVTGATSLAALSTSGTVTFNAFTVTNATTLSGAVSLGSTLTVTGTTTLAALSTSGTTTLNALTVTNATTLSGAVSLGSTLTVTGTTTLAALALTTLTASGAVAFQSTFAVTTSTALGALSCTTLTASGAVAFQSTLAVTGTTTLAALNTGAIGTGNVTITGTLSTSGTTTLNALTVTNALTVSGATTLTGAVTASNASNNIVGIDVAKLGGVAQSLTDLKDFADTGYDPATHKVAGVVLTDTLTTYTGNTPQTGDSYAIVNSGTFGNAAIKGYVDDIGVAGAGLTAIPWNAAWDAEVQSECADALADYDGPTNAEMEARTLLAAAYGTAANQVTIAGYIDTEVATIITQTAAASIRTAVGLASANLDTQLAAIQADSPNTPTKNIALSDLMLTMVDSTDLNTPETGVTVAATISKDGGAFASCSNSVSEVSGGWYKITLTSTEMNADAVALKFTGTGCAQRNIYMRTQPT